MKQISSLLLFFVVACSCGAQTKISSSQSALSAKILKPNGVEQKDRFLCSVMDKAGNIWFGTTGHGVYRYNGKSFTHFTTADGLTSDQVSCIMEDKNGNIWFGTDNGACYYDGKRITRLFIPGLEKSFFYVSSSQMQQGNDYADRHFYVTNIVEDKKGNVWLGTSGGAYRYDGRSVTCYLDSLCKLDNKYHPASTVNNIYEDRQGNLWFSSEMCGVSHRLDHAHVGDSVISRSSFVKLTTAEGRSTPFECALEAKDGTLWFGTYDSGVYQYDGKYLRHFSAKDELGSSYVKTIIEDNQGNIWLGTYFKNTPSFAYEGVYRYSGKELTRFTKKDGLSDADINSIVQDKNGRIWFATDGGLSFYDGAPSTSGHKVIGSFTGKNGFVDDQVSTVVSDRNGSLWFGTFNFGLFRYDGKNFTEYTEHPKTIITNK